MSAKLLDRVLETPIAPSFTRIGAIVRSRTEHWTDLDDFDLTGRTILLTGATSGLGLAAAHRLAGLGATCSSSAAIRPRPTPPAQPSPPRPERPTPPCTPTSAISPPSRRSPTR